MRNLTKALTVVSLLAPVSGYPLGIGDIKVRSALNQNLNAEIALIVSPNENPNSIKVNLAPPERFDSAGVSWSYFLSKIRFKPIVKPNGSVIVKITSTEALKEPYLNFLLEVSWPKGNLYREFTVLVDPPAEYQEPAYRAESNYENYAEPEQRYTPRPRQNYDRPAIRRPVKQRMRAPSNPAGSFGGEIIARRNDTLWKVAARAKGGSDVSVEQMMMALYDSNPNAFFQPNVNALSAGKTLHVPAKSTVQQLTRQQALAAFSRHNQAWVNHSGVPEAEETVVAKEQAVENQLKLVAPTESTVSGGEKVAPSSEQAASGTSSSNTAAGSQKPADAAAGKTVNPVVDEAVQSKLDVLQKQLETMQQIIALKDKQLAELQNAGQKPPVEVPPVTKGQPPETVPPVEQKPAEPVQPPVVEPVPPVITPVKPVEPVKPVPVAPKPVVAPDTVAKETDSSYLGIIGGTVLAFMGLLGWIWWRKQKMLAELDAESMFGNYSIMRNNEANEAQPGYGKAKSPAAAAAGAAMPALADESSFLNEFKPSDFESFESFNVDHGDIDPVAEADVYLAYGRYQQAEELMLDSIKSSPDRDECKLKLLEIYQVSGNKTAFENYAAELIAAGKNRDRDFWDKVCEFSKEILPDSEMFQADHSPAVFPAAEADATTEAVLVSPAQEPAEAPKPSDDSKYQGAAQFDVDESIDEESTFASSLFQEPEDRENDEFDIAVPDEPAESVKPASATAPVSLIEFEDDAASDDNESIDFNLGPYPGTNSGKHTDSGTKESSLFVKEDKPVISQNALANKELESFEFDFDFDKPEVSKAASSTKQTVQDTWDTEQTIDFSFDIEDSKQKTEAIVEPKLDLDFDVAMPELPSRMDDQPDGVNVSDLTDMDEMETKLDLAKAYIDMGDPDSAKDIISQVVANGSTEQKRLAQVLLQEIS